MNGWLPQSKAKRDKGPHRQAYVPIPLSSAGDSASHLLGRPVGGGPVPGNPKSRLEFCKGDAKDQDVQLMR
jgi:hypothetical protein